MSANWVLIIIFGSIAVITAIIIFLAVRMTKNQKKRESEIELLAEEMGWKSEKNWKYSELAIGFGKQLQETFSYFKNSPAVQSKNLAQCETNGAEVRIFDCGTKFGRNFSFVTAVHFQSGNLNLPSFSLFPEGVVRKIGGFFGARDIDFEAHPEFSKSYVLKSDDEQSVRRISDNSVLPFYAQNSGLTVLGNGSRLLFFRANDFELPAREFKSLLDEALKTFHLFETASRRINP